MTKDKEQEQIKLQLRNIKRLKRDYENKKGVQENECRPVLLNFNYENIQIHIPAYREKTQLGSTQKHQQGAVALPEVFRAEL